MRGINFQHLQQIIGSNLNLDADLVYNKTPLGTNDWPLDIKVIKIFFYKNNAETKDYSSALRSMKRALYNYLAGINFSGAISVTRASKKDNSVDIIIRRKYYKMSRSASDKEPDSEIEEEENPINNRLHFLLERWVATGRAAFYHPRKKTVSLNGKKEITEKEALIYLKDFFKDVKKKNNPIFGESMNTKMLLGAGLILAAAFIYYKNRQKSINSAGDILSPLNASPAMTMQMIS